MIDSAKVHTLDTTRWEWEQLPDLNIARYNHSSTSLGEAAYVACGVSKNDGFLNSVERLGMSGRGSAK